MGFPAIKKLDLNASKYPVTKNLKPAIQFSHVFNNRVGGGISNDT